MGMSTTRQSAATVEAQAVLINTGRSRVLGVLLLEREREGERGRGKLRGMN
jgi:hypothetical protein